jgi:dihydroorotase
MFPLSAHYIDPQKKEIIPVCLEECGNNIKAISGEPASTDNSRYSASDRDGECFLCPGFIDLHTHVLDAFTILGVKADLAGLCQGVHLLADAGSAGADTADVFPEYIFPASDISIKVWLNICSTGIVDLQECGSLRLLDVKKCVEYAEKHRDWICGIKVRSSADVVGEQGLQPLFLAKQAAREAGLPLMVHIGGAPPNNTDIVDILDKGDVVSHFLHGNNNSLFDNEGQPVPAMVKARNRGVLFDLAHGAGSFSFETANRALSKPIGDFCISTDLHSRNINGIVKNLPRVMTKLYNLGLPRVDIIRGVTVIPADILKLNNWIDFTLEEPVQRGTLIRLRGRRESDGDYKDAAGNDLLVRWVIEPVCAIKNGRVITAAS